VLLRTLSGSAAVNGCGVASGAARISAECCCEDCVTVLNIGVDSCWDCGDSVNVLLTSLVSSATATSSVHCTSHNVQQGRHLGGTGGLLTPKNGKM